MKKTGDNVKFSTKYGVCEYALGKSLGGGGEGSVFEITTNAKNGLVPAAVKIIDTSKKSQKEILTIKRRIQELIDIRNASKEKAKTKGYVPLSSFMTLPQAMLDGDVGYVMGKVDGHEPLTNYITIPKDEQEQIEWQKKYDLRRRYKVIAYLFERLEKIHIEGLIFSDLSPNNILVSEKNDASPRFIDTDNLRTKASPFTNVLGTPGFIAPELYKDIDSSAALTGEEAENANKVHFLSEESDVYSAAVIAFELLTLNHPFKGIKAIGEDTTPDDELAAERGEMDYILKPGTDNYCDSNIFVEKFDDITTPEIRDLFARTFIAGKENPLRRPSASEFKNEFQRASRLIVNCPFCGEEMIYSIESGASETFSSHTACINPECEKKIEGQLVLLIYAIGKNQSPDEVILGPKAAIHSKESVVISTIILHEDETEKVYFPDIGISGDLKDVDRFMEIKVSKDTAHVRVLQQPKGSTIEIASTKGAQPVQVIESASFPYDHDYLRFHQVKTRYGTLAINGTITRI